MLFYNVNVIESFDCIFLFIIYEFNFLFEIQMMGFWGFGVLGFL